MYNAFTKVALLGRPNVGKSTLFNRLIRSNRAITHDRPGVTRDRMEGIVQPKHGEKFTIIDTGGVTLESEARVTRGPEELQGFEEAILAQAKDAIDESALLCFVVDGKDGLTPFDSHLADFLRKQNKPLLLVVNKVDGPEQAELLMADFHQLGFEMIPVSASHGFNVRALEDELAKRLGGAVEQQGEEKSVELPESMQGATKRQKKRMLADLEAELAREQPQTDVLSDAEPDEPSAVLPNSLPDALSGVVPCASAGATDRAAAATDAGLDNGVADSAEEESASLDLAEISVEDIEAESPEEEEDLVPFYTVDGPLRLALLGRPNAGKSSLVNAMVGGQRMIVSDIAGTTRDSVDVVAEIDGEPCIFVDTAGVRRRARITDTVERYSVNSSLKSTTKAHVTLLVLDVSEGLTSQDKRLVELLSERKTPFIVLVNKVDLLASRERPQLEKDIKGALAFCEHVPVLFISALKKRNLKRIVPLARKIRQECGVRIGTGQLNRAMTQVLEKHQPPMVKGARAKFFYLTQAESAPPTFVFFVNSAERVMASYARYLEKSLRKAFGIQYAPVRLHFRSSHIKKKRKK